MILNKNIINNEDKIKEFSKKLNNFLKNAPVVVDVIYNKNKVIIKNVYGNYEKSFDLDFSIEVKSLIYKIKEDLIKYVYPIITGIHIKKVDYTEAELSDIVDKNSNVSVESLVLNKKDIKTEVNLRIEKVFEKKDIIHIRNLITNKIYQYKMNISCFLFLKKLLNKELNNYQGFNLFKSKCELIKTRLEKKEKDLNKPKLNLF